MDIPDLPASYTRNPPATPEALDHVRASLPVELPADYIALLSRADGLIADHFVVYPCADLAERNETFEVAFYAPGFVTIGDDNGGRAIMLRGGGEPSPVFVVGHGSMSPEDMVELAPTLSAWIRAGCPLEG